MKNNRNNLPVLNFFRKGNRVHVAEHDFGYEGEDIRITITKRDDIGYDVRFTRIATDHVLIDTTCYAYLSAVRYICRQEVAKLAGNFQIEVAS